MTSSYGPKLDLLDNETLENELACSMHAFKTAPVFTEDVLAALGPSVLPQKALYGRVITQAATSFPVTPKVPKLYINANAPFNALVCGVQVRSILLSKNSDLTTQQGSGKSHSTSVLLESCLMADARLGTLPSPLSALV